MRLHAVILGVAVAGLAGWLLLWPREEQPDLLRARDRLIASDALVVRFDPGGVGGYRYILLADEGWVWERTDAAGVPYPDALLFDGERHLLRIADACHIVLHDVRPPLIPGVTVAPRLVRQSIDEQAGERYVYSVAPGFAARPDQPLPLPDLEVTEDLSLIRSEGMLRATTGSGPGFTWRGDYTIRAATADEATYARTLLEGAVASEHAEMVVRERVFGNIIGNIISEPSAVVVAEGCPERPARLWAGSRGGQAEGLRSTPAPFALTHGESPVFRNATTTSASIRGPVEYLERAFVGGTFGDVPVTHTDTILVKLGSANGVAISVLSCTSRPWFRC